MPPQRRPIPGPRFRIWLAASEGSRHECRLLRGLGLRGIRVPPLLGVDRLEPNVCVCKNHLFRRTSPVRDSYGQWSICNDRSLYPVSTSPAKTQNRDNEDRTSTSHLDLVISIRMYRYVIFESQRKPMTARKSICCESQFPSPPPRVPRKPPGW